MSYQEQAQARQQAELQAELAQKNAIPRLLTLGLSVEQIAEALSLSVKQVQQFVQE